MQETSLGFWLHKIATALILLGFALLCQPFTVALYALGFPTLLVGIVLFIIADHLPAPSPLTKSGRSNGRLRTGLVKDVCD